jgi:hypothetical protein
MRFMRWGIKATDSLGGTEFDVIAASFSLKEGRLGMENWGLLAWIRFGPAER